MLQISLLENTWSMHYIITLVNHHISYEDSREVSHGVMVSTAAHLCRLLVTVTLVHGWVESYNKLILIQYNVFENTLTIITVSDLSCLLLCWQNENKTKTVNQKPVCMVIE